MSSLLLVLYSPSFPHIILKPQPFVISGKLCVVFKSALVWELFQNQ